MPYYPKTGMALTGALWAYNVPLDLLSYLKVASSSGFYLSKSGMFKSVLWSIVLGAPFLLMNGALQSINGNIEAQV